MKLTTLKLIFLLAWNGHSIIAMHQIITLPESRIIHQSALKYIPKQLILLNPDEKITDELLHRTNPNWRRIELIDEISWRPVDPDDKIPPQTPKTNLILAAAAEYDDDALSYDMRRCIIALAVCSGANPNHKCRFDYTPLHVALSEQDYQLADYLLAKGADPNLPSKEQYSRKVPLAVCKTIKLAQLLLDHNAEIPRDILAICCKGEYPPELLTFYLDKGALRTPDILKNTPLHALTSCKQKGAIQAQKAHILFAAGFDPAIQNTHGNTMLHLLATPPVKSQEIYYLCAAFINHYLTQHAGFLTFLMHLKRVCPTFYQTKGLLKQYLHESAYHMKKLHSLLSIKNKASKTAYDIWSIDQLNPATCSYKKLKIIN